MVDNAPPGLDLSAFASVSGSGIIAGGLVRIVKDTDGTSTAVIGHINERQSLPLDCCVYRDVPDTLADLDQ